MAQPYGFRRGLLWPQTIYLPAPTGGWNPDANMWELDNSQAPVLDNWLPRTGKVVARGPFVNVTDIATSNFFQGAVILDAPAGSSTPSGLMLVQFHVNDSTHFIEPWNAPWLNAPTANLAAVGGALARVGLDTGTTVFAASAAADTAIGPRWINFNGLLYGISYDAAAAAVTDVNGNYHMKPLNLLTLPQSAAPSSTSANGGAPSVTSNNSFGSVVWNNPTNASTVDGTFATSTNTTAPALASTQLHAVGFGFAIPAGATITGIQVNITRLANVNTGTEYVQDFQLHLIKAGVQVNTADRAATTTKWPTSATLATYGGPGDLWGSTWTPADINNSLSGARLMASMTRVASSVTASVDAMQMIVFYTLDVPPTPTVLSNAPHGAFDLKGYLSRVWLLGGIDTPGGLTTHEPATLFFSNPLGTTGAGSPLGVNSADWKDPITGFTNKLTMDANNSDFGVGLAQAPNALMIFRHSSVWRLTGTTSSSFVLKPMSREVGCVDARSIVETDKGVFWVSQRGLMFTDGTTVRNVSGPVQNDLVAAVNAIFLFMRRDAAMPWVTCGLTSQGQLLITTGWATNTSGAITRWSGMYDPATGAWNRLTSLLWSSGTDDRLPYWLVNRVGRQQLYSVGDLSGSQHIVQLENYGYNDGGNWGLTFLSPLPSQNGNFDINKADLSQLNFPAGNMLRIPYRWVTKLFPMGPEHRQAKAKRFFLDHTNAQFGNDTVTNGWTLQPFSSNFTIISGNALEVSARQITRGANVGGRTVIGGGSARYATPPYVTRFSARADWEFNDLFFDLQSNAVAGGNNVGDYLGELYGLGVEYMTTREYEGNKGNVGATGGSNS